MLFQKKSKIADMWEYSWKSKRQIRIRKIWYLVLKYCSYTTRQSYIKRDATIFDFLNWSKRQQSCVLRVTVLYQRLYSIYLAPTSSTGYSGALYSSSPVFTRPQGSAYQYYYYQAIQVTTFTSGTFSFTTLSSIDTYGCFYNYPFDPSYSNTNLIAQNDDGSVPGDGNQFRINATLQSSRTYVLVVTTYRESTTGSFSIRASGPASVNLMSFTPSTSRPIRTTSKEIRYYTSTEKKALIMSI